MNQSENSARASDLSPTLHCVDDVDSAQVRSLPYDQHHLSLPAEGLNRLVPVKCIEQAGELPDRATCAQPARAYECDVEKIRLISANQLQLAR